jgi:tetratricopeptide (TPR) repeat protein
LFATCICIYAGELDAITSALRARDFNTALNISRQSLKDSPNDPRLKTLEGMALEGLGRENEALAAYKAALKSSPDYLPALEAEAQIEYKERNTQAARTLNRIIDLRPADQVPHAMMAALSYEAGDCKAAVRHYGQARNVMDSQPAALDQYGRCLVMTGEVKEAVPVFERIAWLRSSDSQSQYNLAVVRMMTHDPQGALAALDGMKGADALQPMVLELRSAAYEALGDTPKAVEALQQSIREDPHRVDPYLDFVALCLDHKSYQVAIDYVNAGLKEMPQNAKLYVARGIVFVQLGNYDSATKDFETGEGLDPVHSFGSMAQGLSQMQESKLDQALATTDAEIKRNPYDAFLQYLKAETLRRQGIEPGTPAFEEALQAAVRAVRLAPHFYLAQDLVGVLYLQSGRNDLASEEFRAALADDPADQSALYHLLTIARKGGQTQLTQDLAKRLAQAKQQAREEDIQASRYRILESTRTVVLGNSISE